MPIRRALPALAAGAILLAAVILIRRAPPAAPPRATTTMASARTATISTGPRRAPAPAPSAPLPSPAPSLPASAYLPIIDMPADPPPIQGAGDDFLESNLPRAVFDGKVALEAEAPTAAKLTALEGATGHKIAPETKEAVEDAFRRRDDDAAVAIGTYRLHQLSEDEATAQIARARDRYEVEAARALGLSREAFTRAFKADP